MTCTEIAGKLCENAPPNHVTVHPRHRIAHNQYHVNHAQSADSQTEADPGDRTRRDAGAALAEVPTDHSQQSHHTPQHT